MKPKRTMPERVLLLQQMLRYLVFYGNTALGEYPLTVSDCLRLIAQGFRLEAIL